MVIEPSFRSIRRKSNMEEQFGLEDSIFTWDGWDDGGIMNPIFYKVVLKVPVGEFPVGHQFPCACINGDKSSISFIDDAEVEHLFELKLSIGKLLTREKTDE